MNRTSALDPYVHSGRKELKGTRVTLFEDSLESISSIRVPIATSDDDDGISVHHWHSHQEVVEAIREWIEFEDEVEEEKEKIDAYDRAMSIL